MSRFNHSVVLASFLALGLCGLSAMGCAPTAYGVYEVAIKKKKKRRGGAVPATSTRIATLRWDPPTHRVNGQPLGSELAGYKLYRGTAPRTYDTVVDLPNPLTTQHATAQLPPGRYYFAVSAYDVNGLESGYSNEADKLIQ